MRAQTAFLAATAVSTVLFSGVTLAEGNPRSNYNEPTRGFLVEHGRVAPNRQAALELHSGSDFIDDGGGVRLGLPGSELILNSGVNGYDKDQILLKYGMSNLNLGGESANPVDWAIVAGFSHTDLEDTNGNQLIDQTNLKLGATFTVSADAGTFTLGPRFVYADGDQRDDNFIEVDLGAYVGIVDTQAGLFSAGFEAIFTSEDNRDETFAFGMRWAYNKQLNIDIVPLVYSNDQLDELIGIPGVVRVNYQL